jgi:hypothetical protein
MRENGDGETFSRIFKSLGADWQKTSIEPLNHPIFDPYHDAGMAID